MPKSKNIRNMLKARDPGDESGAPGRFTNSTMDGVSSHNGHKYIRKRKRLLLPPEPEPCLVPLSLPPS